MAAGNMAAQNRFLVQSKSVRDSFDSQATNLRPTSREKLHIPLPPLPNTFPELEKLSVAQLKKLLTDDAAINVWDLVSSSVALTSCLGSYC
jgi:hypothetical protein